MSSAPSGREKRPVGVPGTLAVIPRDRPDVGAILYALSNSQIKGLAVVQDPNMPEHKIWFEIGAVPS